MINITDDGARDLINAVVIQAAKDYRSALYKYNTAKCRQDKQDQRNIIGECEFFFRTNLSAYSDLDGNKIIETIIEHVRLSLEKKGMIMEVPKV